MPTTLDKRIEHFLDNDLPHIQHNITTLNVKMWFALVMLTIVLAAIVSPLVTTAIAGGR